MTLSIQCIACVHFNNDKFTTCLAYPEGIPVKFMLEDVIHDKVMKDQKGDYVHEYLPETKKILDETSN